MEATVALPLILFFVAALLAAGLLGIGIVRGAKEVEQ